MSLYRVDITTQNFVVSFTTNTMMVQSANRRASYTVFGLITENFQLPYDGIGLQATISTLTAEKASLQPSILKSQLFSSLGETNLFVVLCQTTSLTRYQKSAFPSAQILILIPEYFIRANSMIAFIVTRGQIKTIVSEFDVTSTNPAVGVD